jgi:hypothetical protein
LLADKLVPVVAIHSLGGHVLKGITGLTRNRKMRIHKPRAIH